MIEPVRGRPNTFVVSCAACGQWQRFTGCASLKELLQCAERRGWRTGERTAGRGRIDPLRELRARHLCAECALEAAA